MSIRAARAAARIATPPPRRADLRLVKPAEDPRVEQRLIALGIAETVALEKGRGERFVGASPHHRLDPIARLMAEGRLSRQQGAAGYRYAQLYRNLYDSQRARLHWREFFEVKTAHALKINRIRREAFGNNHDQMFLCDQICGRERKPEDLWGVRWRDLVIEHLSAALTSLGVHYGLLWRTDDVD